MAERKLGSIPKRWLQIAAFGTALPLTACALPGNQPAEKSVSASASASSEQEVKTWRTEVITADNNAKFIGQLSEVQTPYTGLNGIFIVADQHTSLALIVAVWNPSDVDSKVDSNSGATLEFQALGEEFMPKRDTPATIPNEMADYAKQFTNDGTTKILNMYHGMAEKGELPKTLPATKGILFQSFNNLPVTLVFDQGIVSFQGKDSPQSYLRVSFRFQNNFQDPAAPKIIK